MHVIHRERTTAKSSRQKVGEGLMHYLADIYLLYLKTQNFHWNVRGPNFQALHQFFEAEYQELAAAIDTLAERIRAAVAAEPFVLTAQVQRSLSASVGVAVVSPSRDDNDFKSLADRLLADADAALYRAKALGRNRIQTGSG